MKEKEILKKRKHGNRTSCLSSPAVCFLFLSDILIDISDQEEIYKVTKFTQSWTSSPEVTLTNVTSWSEGCRHGDSNLCIPSDAAFSAPRYHGADGVLESLGASVTTWCHRWRTNTEWLVLNRKLAVLTGSWLFCCFMCHWATFGGMNGAPLWRRDWFDLTWPHFRQETTTSGDVPLRSQFGWVQA